MLGVCDTQFAVQMSETLTAGHLHYRRGVGRGQRSDQFRLSRGVLTDLTSFVLDVLHLVRQRFIHFFTQQSYVKSFIETF